ncbi:hypothetical protein F0562_010629 [Nyssa sinensis]|uniref:Uncharacterized protein n=1 Tax=Nyssa sinensis TaxID=561372 RepID=A0A5J5A2C2_9ASTE|nr:hypothetical protein F0562_010629 [Nyssa sinensis]
MMSGLCFVDDDEATLEFSGLKIWEFDVRFTRIMDDLSRQILVTMRRWKTYAEGSVDGAVKLNHGHCDKLGQWAMYVVKLKR